MDQPTAADKEKGEEEVVGEQEQLQGALLRGLEGEWVAAFKLGAEVERGVAMAALQFRGRLCYGTSTI